MEREWGCVVGEEARETREREELQKAYLILLNAAANNELASSLIQMNGSSLDLVLQALLAGAAGHVDTTMRKYCYQASSFSKFLCHFQYYSPLLAMYRSFTLLFFNSLLFVVPLFLLLWIPSLQISNSIRFPHRCHLVMHGSICWGFSPSLET